MSTQQTSSKPHPPQMPFTPPHSSRSTFAELPLTQKTPNNHQPPIFSSKNSSPNSSQSSDSDKMDQDEDEEDDEDDNDGAFDDSDEEEEPQRSFNTQPSVNLTPGYHGSEAFTTEDSPFALIQPADARVGQRALAELTKSITSTLTQYQIQFQLWESTPHPPLSVIRASLLLDQGLARFTFSLEPLKFTAASIIILSQLLNQLGSFLRQNHLDQNTTTTIHLWDALGRLADQTFQVEDSLTSGTLEVRELYYWVDALLTPALAEVKFLRLEPDELVSDILDVHSYLCDSLGKAASILSVYRSGLAHINRAIETLQNSLLAQHHHSNSFPVHQTIDWTNQAAISLTSIADSITDFSSISSCIQISTQGALHATTDPPDSNQHPSTQFCHAISY